MSAYNEVTMAPPRFKKVANETRMIVAVALSLRNENHIIVSALIRIVILVNNTTEYSMTLKKSMTRKMELPKMVINVTSRRDAMLEACAN